MEEIKLKVVPKERLGSCEGCVFKGACTGTNEEQQRTIDGKDYDCAAEGYIYKEYIETSSSPKSNTEMPELEAGMIVEIADEEDGESYGLFLYINTEWCIKLEDENGWQGIRDEVFIKAVYTVNHPHVFTGSGYNHLKPENLTLLWKLKSKCR